MPRYLGTASAARCEALFPEARPDETDLPAGIGSTLLLPEVLTKPTGDGASYRLRSADAVHLATAVSAGADRFITNNRRDFSPSIEEVSITYPTDLP